MSSSGGVVVISIAVCVVMGCCEWRSGCEQQWRSGCGHSVGLFIGHCCVCVVMCCEWRSGCEQQWRSVW